MRGRQLPRVGLDAPGIARRPVEPLVSTGKANTRNSRTHLRLGLIRRPDPAILLYPTLDFCSAAVSQAVARLRGLHSDAEPGELPVVAERKEDVVHVVQRRSDRVDERSESGVLGGCARFGYVGGLHIDNGGW